MSVTHGINIERSILPNVLSKEASLCLQIGRLGFDYKRSDLGNNIRFIGALLPYSSDKNRPPTLV
jgi:hypothetical protein